MERTEESVLPSCASYCSTSQTSLLRGRFRAKFRDRRDVCFSHQCSMDYLCHSEDTNGETRADH